MWRMSLEGMVPSRERTLRGVPIETDRLLLRPLMVSDLEEFVGLHEDPEVVGFVRALDSEQAARRLHANEQEWGERGHGMLAVIGQADGRLLGRVGLKYWSQFGETEAGWLLRRDAWGCGYATEAARACLEWGFTTLPVAYVTAMIAPGNTRSVRVAQRLGFKPSRQDVLLGDPVIVHVVERTMGRQAV
jgi:RimJ/RimL family protein N-acetyltransferase